MASLAAVAALLVVSQAEAQTVVTKALPLGAVQYDITGPITGRTYIDVENSLWKQFNSDRATPRSLLIEYNITAHPSTPAMNFAGNITLTSASDCASQNAVSSAPAHECFDLASASELAQLTATVQSQAAEIAELKKEATTLSGTLDSLKAMILDK